MIGIESLFDQWEIVFSQTTLETEQVRKHPRFILEQQAWSRNSVQQEGVENF